MAGLDAPPPAPISEEFISAALVSKVPDCCIGGLENRSGGQKGSSGSGRHCPELQGFRTRHNAGLPNTHVRVGFNGR